MLNKKQKQRLAIIALLAILALLAGIIAPLFVPLLG